MDRAIAPAEGAGGEVERLLMTEVAGNGDHRIRGPVGRRPEGADAIRRQAANVGLLAADLATERARPEHRLLEQDLRVLRRVVEVAADLLDDDLALAVDLGDVQVRPADELTEDRHGPLGLASGHADPV